ncbi:MAG: protein translocase subunit SecD [Lachnospiraceae bacterium]|nr:protein translocase subunit SecD [Lachnospiraceae bacterium]
MKKKHGVAALLLLLAAVIFFGWYTFGILNRTVEGKKDSIKLGLDLAGGVSITYEVVGDTPTTEQLDDTVTKLKTRIENDLGKESTTEANVYKVGDRRVAVEIPGVSDANALLEQLGTPGNLYFINATGKDGSANYEMDSKGEYKLAEGKTIDSLKKDGSIILTGSSIKSADGGYSSDSTTGNQKPIVQLSLNKKGTKAFADATSKAVGSTIGIYYDGKFLSVPRVNEAITGGQCEISGMKDIDEAKSLASYIRIGGLDIQIKELQSEVVGASLGTDALSTSLIAAGIGLLIVMVFMLLMYRILGAAADLALILYTELIVCILYWFGITLTLPGVAGIILGIGMAVDANVIIFSRIKEEIGIGHSVGSSIDAGFNKAMSAILDGNVTTLIAAAVLGVIGTGTVKGFAITLAIGVLLSLFSAVLISKLIVRSIFAVGCKNEKAYGKTVYDKTLNFMSKTKIFFTASILVIAIGIGAMIVNGVSGNKPLAYSLEFAGGTATTVKMNKNYTVDEINKEIVPVVAKTIGSNDIQTQAVDQDSSIVIKTQTLSLEKREKLNTALEKNFGVKEKNISSRNISAMIGKEMRHNSTIAVIVSVFFMLIYIWFRFKDIRFGSSAIIALAHDVLVTITVYAVLRLSVGSAFIACVLTIIGYSVNDTIVIFDRIRENLADLTKDKKGDYEVLKTLSDNSITETISRSLSTSFTTAVMVLMLLILGVSTIKEFALPLLVGVLCGTYSSICIATELWLLMHKKDAKVQAKQKITSKKSKMKSEFEM